MKSMPSTGARSSLAAALQMVGDRWTLLLVHDMATLGLCRFDQLRATGISSSTLSLRLKAFEAQGLVERVRYDNRPPRDEYRLTDLGRDLWTVIAALLDWGDRWERSKESVGGHPRSGAHGAVPALSQAAVLKTGDNSDCLDFYFDF